MRLVVTNNYAPAFVASQQYRIAPRDRRVIFLRVQIKSVTSALRRPKPNQKQGLSKWEGLLSRN
jgi:hypothetical protein